MGKALPFHVFELWRAFFNENPFGPWRDNFNSAIAASFHANLKAGKKIVSPQDFMYESPSQARRRKSVEREKSTLEVINQFRVRAK